MPSGRPEPSPAAEPGAWRLLRELDRFSPALAFVLSLAYAGLCALVFFLLAGVLPPTAVRQAFHVIVGCLLAGLLFLATRLRFAALAAAAAGMPWGFLLAAMALGALRNPHAPSRWPDLSVWLFLPIVALVIATPVWLVARWVRTRKGEREGRRGAVGDRLTIRRGRERFGCLSLLVWMRAGTTIDRRARTITSWSGAFVFLKRRSASMDAARTVTISRAWKEDWSHENSGKVLVFEVRVSTEGEPILVDELSDRAKARRRAEEVAKFLGVGLADSSGERTIVREAGTLDMSLRERRRARGQKLEMPRTPEATRSKVSVNGTEAAFELPPPGFRPFSSPGVILTCAAAVLTVVLLVVKWVGADVETWGEEGMPSWLILGISLAGFAVASWFLFADIRRGTWPQHLTVNPGELRFRRRSRGGLEERDRSIPADELEELEVEGDAVVARSDREVIEFGHGLERAELEWIRSVVEFIVAS